MRGAEDPRAALAALVDALSEPSTWPGAGAGAGLVVALAAGLIEAVARQSTDRWAEARGAIAQAAAVRRRALRLAAENAEGHAAAREALGAVPDNHSERQTDVVLGDALERAADLPLRIAAAAVDAAELAALAAARGTNDARADAVGAAQFAAAAAAAAAHLVEVNLATQPGDDRAAKARELASLARAASKRALAHSL